MPIRSKCHILTQKDSLYSRLRSFACQQGWIKLAPRAHRITAKMLFDPERSVILDWSAKAGCTIGAKMFFRHMGLLDEALEYNPWVHDYRREVFQQRNPVTVQDLLSRDNVLLKIVRNPYTRIISSLRNKVRVPGKNSKIMEFHGLLSMEQITFRRFIEFLEATDLRRKCDVHYREQVQDYELMKLRHPIVIKLENLQDDIKQVNDLYGFAFDLEGLDSEHHAEINRDWDGAAGDVPWGEFSHGLPEYQHFYDEELHQRVSSLYQRDLDAYQYSYPWSQQ